MKLKKDPPTPEEQLKKKEEAEAWAKERLADPRTLIVDTETTGILSRDPEAKIVSISMINTKGQVVLASLLNPERPIPLEAQKIHGIEDRDVKDSWPFRLWAPCIASAMHGRHIVAFNAAFDIHQIVTQFGQVAKAEEEFPMPEFEASCAMEYYSQFVGDWSKAKEDYKWQRLPKLAFGKAHDSMVDCQSTLLLLKKMAGDFSSDPDPNDIDLSF